MTMFLHLFGNMACNLLVLVALTYLLSRLEAATPTIRTMFRGSVFGLAMGSIAVMLMLTSFDTSRGLLIDLRSVALVMSGVIGGPLAAIVTAAVTISARFAMGEANYALIGVAASALAVLGIVAWAMRVGTTLRSLLAIGVAIAVLHPVIVMLTEWLGWLDSGDGALLPRRDSPDHRDILSRRRRHHGGAPSIRRRRASVFSRRTGGSRRTTRAIERCSISPASPCSGSRTASASCAPTRGWRISSAIRSKSCRACTTRTHRAARTARTIYRVRAEAAADQAADPKDLRAALSAQGRRNRLGPALGNGAALRSDRRSRCTSS